MVAVDIALWDLKSKIARVPFTKLLGGAREKVPVYNTDGGWLNHTLEQLRGENKQIVAAGFRGTKIKVGKDDPMEDRERIAAVRPDRRYCPHWGTTCSSVRTHDQIHCRVQEVSNILDRVMGFHL